MISSVTTATVTTVTTAGLAGPMALAGILVLLALLLQKEVATALPEARARRLGEALNIGILPLIGAFVLIAVFKIAEVL